MAEKKNQLVRFDPQSLIQRMGGDRSLLEAQMPLMIARMQQKGHRFEEEDPSKIWEEFFRLFEEFLRSNIEEEVSPLGNRNNGMYWLSFAQNPVPGISGLYEMQNLRSRGRWDCGDSTYTIGLTIGDLPIPDQGEIAEICAVSPQASEQLETLYRRMIECGYNNGRPFSFSGVNHIDNLPSYKNLQFTRRKAVNSSATLENRFDNHLRVQHNKRRVLTQETAELESGDLISIGPIVFNYLET